MVSGDPPTVAWVLIDQLVVDMRREHGVGRRNARRDVGDDQIHSEVPLTAEDAVRRPAWPPGVIVPKPAQVTSPGPPFPTRITCRHPMMSSLSSLLRSRMKGSGGM